MAQIMSEVLGKPVRYQQIPAEALKNRLTGAGMSDAMAQATVDMMVAKDQGLDNAEPRTPESTTPTTFRQWCEEILGQPSWPEHRRGDHSSFLLMKEQSPDEIHRP